MVFSPVRGRVDRDAAGRAGVQLMAQIAGQNAAESAIRLTLEPSAGERQRLGDGRRSTPAAAQFLRGLIAAVVPGFSSFGPAAQFKGAVQWTLDRPEPRVVVQGRVEQVDLASVLPAGSPHSLHGAATVEFQELSWRGSRIERLVGTVHAEKAPISRSLVAASVQNYKCGGTDGVATIDDPAMVALDQLAVRFELDENGLSFWGNFPAEAHLPTGCLAVSGLQPLLIQSPYDKWHLGLLVQTLAAPGITWMPATSEAVDMAERLPLNRK